jgi:hypothetical protein
MDDSNLSYCGSPNSLGMVEPLDYMVHDDMLTTFLEEKEFHFAAKIGGDNLYLRNGSNPTRIKRLCTHVWHKMGRKKDVDAKSVALCLIMSAGAGLAGYKAARLVTRVADRMMRK